MLAVVLDSQALGKFTLPRVLVLPDAVRPSLQLPLTVAPETGRLFPSTTNVAIDARH